jgi:hypothetical protein
VFTAVCEAVQEVVAELNQLGHKLELEELVTEDPSLPFGISFVDDRNGGAGGLRRHLRIAFDLTVSAGYAHLAEVGDESGALERVQRPTTKAEADK